MPRCAVHRQQRAANVHVPGPKASAMRALVSPGGCKDVALAALVLNAKSRLLSSDGLVHVFLFKRRAGVQLLSTYKPHLRDSHSCIVWFWSLERA